MVSTPRQPTELPALGIVLVRPDGCVALTNHGDERFELPWRSMSLGFHAFQGETLQPRAGLALPPVQSGATAMIAARRVHQMVSWSDRPVVIENARQARVPGPDELSDGAFLARVALAANCPIALDLECLADDAADTSPAALALAAQLPRQRVAAVRLRLESLPRLLPLLRQLVPRLPQLKAILLDTAADAPTPKPETRELLATLWASRSTAAEPRHDVAPDSPVGCATGRSGADSSCPTIYPTAHRHGAQPARAGRRQRTPLLFLAQG